MNLPGRPDAAPVIDSILMALTKRFNLEITKRVDHVGRVTIRLDGRHQFGLHVTPEQLGIDSPLWQMGQYNWNGKWRIQLDAGEPVMERAQIWRAKQGDAEEVAPQVVDAIILVMKRAELYRKGPRIVK